MESNLNTTEHVHNEQTLSARTNFGPDEPVYNELSYTIFYSSQVKNLGLSIQQNKIYEIFL
jgi:lysozyme family protein